MDGSVTHSNAMVTEYEITRDDLVAFNMYHHQHSSTARREYFRSWLVPALIWMLLCAGIWHLADRERGTPLQTFLDLLPLFSGVPLYLLFSRGGIGGGCARS
jgi:hypothetical protein